eukprot:GHVS01008902.1.p1 GENE.GHVS01008902.1~~GHVS01008902.1.p1  ORF type:complete len:446 (-),score=55.55 GHVS01008902.1:544-1881(-)
MMMSLLEECRGGKQGRGVREHHTGEKDKVRRGKPMGHKAAGFPGCFLVILFVAIGLTLSLKANAETNILVMDLDGTANSTRDDRDEPFCSLMKSLCYGFANLETEAEAQRLSLQISSDMKTALHRLIGKTDIASECLPVFVVTAGNLDRRLDYVAETFGVTRGDIIEVSDIAQELIVTDPYSRDGSWPISGYRIKEGAKWCKTSPACSTSTTGINDERSEEKEETCCQTVARNIFVVSSRDVVGRTVSKHSVLARVIDLSLQKAKSDEQITVYTIGDSRTDLVGKSEGGEILFLGTGQESNSLNTYNMEDINRQLNENAKSHINQQHQQARLDGVLQSSQEAKEEMEKMVPKATGGEGVEACGGSSEWNDVILTDLTIHKLRDNINMKPVIIYSRPPKGGWDKCTVKQFLAGCLHRIPDVVTGPTISTISLTDKAVSFVYYICSN